MSSLTVELRLRRHTPSCTATTEELLVDRVAALEQSGVVADARVKTWDRIRTEMPRDPDDLATVKRFARWADQNGLSLEPAFTRREVTSLIDTERRTEIIVPVACLAVYEDGDLRCVTPCSNGEHVATVSDALARLERGEVEVGIDSDSEADARLADITA